MSLCLFPLYQGHCPGLVQDRVGHRGHGQLAKEQGLWLQEGLRDSHSPLGCHRSPQSLANNNPQAANGPGERMASFPCLESVIPRLGSEGASGMSLVALAH